LMFWPDSDQASARAALRRTLSTMRSALGEELVDFGRELIGLNQGKHLWCDVQAFQEALAECRNHGHPENVPCQRCLAPLSSAVDYYEGDFMSGFSLRDSTGFDDWQFFESDRLRRELGSALERLARILLEKGDYTSAIEQSRRWLSLDMLNEAAHRSLILLYAHNDQRNAALRQYRECVRILDQELGVAPLEETTRLYESVKENQFEIQKANEQPPALNLQSIPGLAKQESIGKSGPVTSSSAMTLPLVGRSSELGALIQFYETCAENGRAAVLTGEAGVGKTRLADEFIT